MENVIFFFQNKGGDTIELISDQNSLSCICLGFWLLDLVLDFVLDLSCPRQNPKIKIQDKSNTDKVQKSKSMTKSKNQNPRQMQDKSKIKSKNQNMRQIQDKSKTKFKSQNPREIQDKVQKS